MTTTTNTPTPTSATADHDTAAIAMQDVVKTYGRVRALDGLSLDVARGEVHGFLGPNGAGKSTSIRILLGILKHDSGRISLLGETVTMHRRDSHCRQERRGSSRDIAWSMPCRSPTVRRPHPRRLCSPTGKGVSRGFPDPGYAESLSRGSAVQESPCRYAPGLSSSSWSSLFRQHR